MTRAARGAFVHHFAPHRVVFDGRRVVALVAEVARREAVEEARGGAVVVEVQRGREASDFFSVEGLHTPEDTPRTPGQSP